MLKEVLQQVTRGQHLSQETMTAAIGKIMDGEATPAQIAALLIALRMKGETIDEITGAALAMRQRMTPIVVDRHPLMDTCGTGGDGANTFNISTTVAFVVAAAGIAVAKHGNRAVSSSSGSADVLQALGVNVGAAPAVVQACIEEIGLGFLFAPSLHPALVHASPVRKELGVRTLFNVLGPLTNPAGATFQLLGVYDRALVAPVAAVLGQLGSEHAWVVHGRDGLDELSTCDVTYVAEWDGSGVREFSLGPEEAGIPRAVPEALRGGDARANATTLQCVLAGELQGPVSDAVAYNAGAALYIAGKAGDLRQGVQLAHDILRSGKGADILERLVNKTNE